LFVVLLPTLVNKDVGLYIRDCC